jgi:hypothetical protein
MSSSSFALTIDTLGLQATVTETVSIAVTALPGASALDLETTASDLIIASVNEKSNSNTGYKVNVKSTNLGALKRSGGTETFGYSLKLGSTAIDLSTVAGQTINHPSAALADVTNDVKISYTGVSNATMVEGTYVDTVTYTISVI